MIVLLTGASGFVGLNLCEYLLGRGDTVIAFSKGPMPEEALADFQKLPGTLKVAEGDVLDESDVRAVFNLNAPEKVIHAAAMTPGESTERHQSGEVMATNTRGVINVLDMVWRHGVGRVLHISSGAVYGANGLAQNEIGELRDLRELTEEHPFPLPVSIYAISKYAGERIALRYRELWDMDLLVVRLGTVFGPWEYPTGVRDTLSAPLLASLIAQFGGQTLPSKEAVLAGKGRKDWLYSRDVAEGLAGLLDAPAPAHALYNLGSGKQWEAVAWCDKLAARYPGFQWRLADKAEEVNVDLYGSTERAPMAIGRLREETGFAPRFGLEEAFGDYMEWMEAHRGFFQRLVDEEQSQTSG